MIKALIIKMTISFGILVVLYLVLSQFEFIDQKYIAPIVVFTTIILSPRMKKIATQTGEKYQLSWFFLKNPMEF